MSASAASHPARGEHNSSKTTVHQEQRRIGHICAILVRNLSLRPTRDRALQTLASRRPGGSSRYHTTSDDADLTLSLSRSSSKGKGKAADDSHRRRRSASWARLDVGSSDDDEGTEDPDANAASTLSKSRLSNSRLDGKNDGRGRPAVPANRRRTSDHELTSTSSLGATSEGIHSFDPSPRPILKRWSSTRDGRETRLHAGSLENASASGFLDELGANTAMLSRSDSCSSSRSSHTIRRPSHRARTTSMTSSGSVRSVRFDESHVGAVDVARRPSRISGRLNPASRNLLFSQKSLAQIMQERMLECSVELSLSSDAIERQAGSSIGRSASNADSAGPVFYRTSNSKPGLHHSWGCTCGDPIHPERDFAIDAETSACVTPLEAPVVTIKVWARVPNTETGASATQSSSSATTGESEPWKLVRQTTVDLRELEPVAGNLQDSSVSLPPNSILLGLALGANSLSGRGSTSIASPQSDLEGITSNAMQGSQRKLTRKVSEREAERTRHILESVTYYSLPLDAAKQGGASRAEADEMSGLVGRLGAAALSTKEGDCEPRLSRAANQHRRASVEGYASDPENASSHKAAMTAREQSQPEALSSRSSGKTTSLAPAPIAATSEARRWERRKAFEVEERRALELSLRETKMMPSYTLDEALQLARKQTELRGLLAEMDELRYQNGSLLQHPEGFVQLRLKCEQQKATCESVRRMVVDEIHDTEQKKAALEQRRSALEVRRNAIRASGSLFRAAEHTRDKLEDAVHTLRSQKAHLEVQVHAQQASLLRDLEAIFPIELCDASSLLFSICGLPLPNAVASLSQTELVLEEKRWKDTVKRHKLPSTRPVFHPFDDDSISSAFGLVAQLVVLLSTYLATPVHYPLATAGSRAVIQDGISLMSGPRAFPLYAKGMERYRYEYAAFLLNKDIEQLMNVHSVTVIDIRHTLPNLKNLMVTVAAAPPTSHLTRKSHIGKNEIALRSAASVPLSRWNEEAAETGGPVLESNDKRSGLGLGLGLPKLVSTKTEAMPDTLVTTRVLGTPSQPTGSPATASGAIASVSRAFSYFSSGGGSGGTAR